MIVIEVLLGFIPVLGPFMAGYFGGKFTRSAGEGLIAALLPALVLVGILWLIGTAAALPVVSTVAGLGILMLFVIYHVPLLLGAAIGGAVSKRQAPPERTDVL